MIAPTTDIILYKSDLELDNTNQLKFNTWNDQWAYFSNLPHIYLDNATYQRKEGVIRFPTQDISFDELIRYNYVSYKNEAYANKTFFAYVKNMRYVNDGMTEIEIETDVFQTWQFDLIYRPCFVEREHVSNDSIGANTVPEGLETGEMVLNAINKYTPLTETCPVMGTTEVINTKSKNNVYFQNNKLRAIGYYIFNGNTLNDPYNITDQLGAIRAAFTQLEGEQDAIVTLFMAPRSLVNWQPFNGSTSSGGDWNPISDSGVNFYYYRMACYGITGFKTNPISMADFTFDRVTSFGSYSPRNNKLKVFPYCYMMLTNNSGTNAIYHYEDFSYNDSNHPNRITFNVKGSLCPGCSIRALPANYKNMTVNYTSGISAGKFPICDYLNDIFINWLTQNGVNFATSTVANVGSIVGGIAAIAGGYSAPLGATMIAGGAAGIFNDMKEIYQKSFTPPQAEGDLGSAEIAYSTGENTFEAHHYRLREEFARQIDSYFTMFGYKVNSLKVPEIHSRENWNYVKTVDCNFSGDIPGDDLIKIRNMFNTGFTIWHKPSTFLDYSQSNNII